MIALYIVLAYFFGIAIGVAFVAGERQRSATLRSELEHAQTEQHAIRLDCSRQINAAFEQSARSQEQARLAVQDARSAMHEAIEMSKVASKALFGGVSDEPAKAMSVALNDREEARRRRNEAMAR